MAVTTVSWRACASSLITLLLVASLASCGSATRDDAGARPTATQPAPGMLKRLSRIQRHNFALLRTRPEGLPARAQAPGTTNQAAMNPALAQRIPVTLPGSYWLVPGIGHLCIVSEIPSTPGSVTICARTQQAIKQGFGTISFTPAEQAPAARPTRLLVGIAPDDARKALIHTNGSVTAVPVVNGIFVLRDSQPGPSDFTELRRTHGN
jgi:hypothetical protein